MKRETVEGNFPAGLHSAAQRGAKALLCGMGGTWRKVQLMRQVEMVLGRRCALLLAQGGDKRKMVARHVAHALDHQRTLAGRTSPHYCCNRHMALILLHQAMKRVGHSA